MPIKKCYSLFAFFSFLLINGTVSFGQYIIAGQHSLNDIYTDIVPDTTFYGHYGPGGYRYDTLKIDIDKNGSSDFEFRVGGG